MTAPESHAAGDEVVQGAENDRLGTCPECVHQWSPNGCTGDPTPSDVWAGVSPSACDCPCPIPPAGTDR